MVLGNHEEMMMEAILQGKGYNWSVEYGEWADKQVIKNVKNGL